MHTPATRETVEITEKDDKNNPEKAKRRPWSTEKGVS